MIIKTVTFEVGRFVPVSILQVKQGMKSIRACLRSPTCRWRSQACRACLLAHCVVLPLCCFSLDPDLVEGGEESQRQLRTQRKSCLRFFCLRENPAETCLLQQPGLCPVSGAASLLRKDPHAGDGHRESGTPNGPVDCVLSPLVPASHSFGIVSSLHHRAKSNINLNWPLKMFTWIKICQLHYIFSHI